MTSLESSMEAVVERLVQLRSIPKYQFERAVEPLLSLFIKEALQQRFNETMDFVVAEFPLKKNNNNQSTNADFLFRSRNGDWILVEIKTERTSVRPEQIEVYDSRVGVRFRKLWDDLMDIVNATSKKSKYDMLVSELNKHRPHHGVMQALYITPHDKSPIEKYSTKVQWCSFVELFGEFRSERHPDLWRLVSRLVDAI